MDYLAALRFVRALPIYEPNGPTLFPRFNERPEIERFLLEVTPSVSLPCTVIHPGIGISSGVLAPKLGRSRRR